MNRTGLIIGTVLIFLIIGAGLVSFSYLRGKEAPKEPSGVLAVTDENFQKTVVEASHSRPVLVDFYADWCFPCKLLDPTIQELAKDFGSRAVIGKVDTQKNMLARRFQVNRIPAIFIIRNGEVKERFVGPVDKETLAKALDENGA